MRSTILELRCDPTPIERLDATTLRAMFDLMTRHYEAVPWRAFERDLAWKDEVLLLRNRNGELLGFSTLAWNPKGLHLSEGDVVFSGDTIIDQAAWGSQTLVRGFCQRAGAFARERERRLFWLLLSKGHRTYLYLPLFARCYTPSVNGPESVLEEIADRAAQHLFPEAWNPTSGLLHFEECQGRLRTDLAGDSQERSHNRHVRFFLQKNPDYALGDELVCLTELSEHNLKRTARESFTEAPWISTI